MIGPQDGGFYFLVAIQQRIEFEWSYFYASSLGHICEMEGAKMIYIISLNRNLAKYRGPKSVPYQIKISIHCARYLS